MFGNTVPLVSCRAFVWQPMRLETYNFMCLLELMFVSERRLQGVGVCISWSRLYVDECVSRGCWLEFNIAGVSHITLVLNTRACDQGG